MMRHSHWPEDDRVDVLFVDRARRVVGLVAGGGEDFDLPPSATSADRERAAGRLTVLVEGASLSSLTPSRVQEALATLKKAGRSLATCNHHRAAIRGLARWAREDGRLRDNPLDGVSGYNANEDRRYDRRTISLDELRKFIDVAHNGPPYRIMTGPARALCYRLAASTGMRFSEIKSTTPRSFALTGEDPIVTVRAGYTKNRDFATFDLPAGLVDDLGSWLAGRPKDGPAFPMPGGGAKMLRKDLEAAGIPYRDDEGLVFDFHAIRCECVTLADLVGASPRIAQRLTRHSTQELTGRYTRHRRADFKEAVAALPSLRPGSTPSGSPSKYTFPRRRARIPRSKCAANGGRSGSHSDGS